MKQKIVSIGTIVLAALLAVGPWTLFKACPTGENIMKCHWCCVALIPVAVILIAIGVLQLLAKDMTTIKTLELVAAIAFVMPILLTTTLIGGCMKAEMACNALTFPVVNALSAVGIILQIIGLIGKKQK